MRPYETIFILRPELEDEAVTAAIERFANLIQQHQGSVEQISRWGKKRLAYEIDDNREGYYTLILFQGEPATAKELDRVMRINDDLLRHIIIRRDAA